MAPAQTWPSLPWLPTTSAAHFIGSEIRVRQSRRIALLRGGFPGRRRVGSGQEPGRCTVQQQAREPDEPLEGRESGVRAEHDDGRDCDHEHDHDQPADEEPGEYWTSEDSGAARHPGDQSGDPNGAAFENFRKPGTALAS
jgi:hypothetical protein